MTALAAVLAAVAGGTAALAPATPAAADRRGGAGTLAIQTVPPVSGARFSAFGTVVRSGSTGIAQLPVRRFTDLGRHLRIIPTRVNRDTRVVYDRMVGTPDNAVTRPLIVGLRTERLVRWTFLDRGGKEVEATHISLLVIKSNTGETRQLTGAALAKPLWVAASRTQQTPQGLVSKPLYWSVSRVVVDGADVVNRGQQQFVPNETRGWTIELLFYRVTVVGRDLLFGGTVGEGVELHRPDGSVVRTPMRDGEAVLPTVPRGAYEIRVDGSGVSFLRPASISRDQTLEIQVITPADLTLIAGTVALFAFSLLLVGRRRNAAALSRRVTDHLRRRLGPGRPRAGRTAALLIAVVAVPGLVLGLPPPKAAADPGHSGPAPSASTGEAVPTSSPRSGARRADPRSPVRNGSPDQPVLAYYYIWFEPSSWQRAKRDYPLLGRYSSDDAVVMRRHVAMAKAAGISGFLVSWKHADHLDPRLQALVSVAREEGFRLGIVYQGLDFARNPLPVARVAADLRFFADRYASEPVFDIFGKPLVVITGTEKFSVSDLETATGPVRDRLLVLGSAKNTQEHQRTARALDGEAYYWSSGDATAAGFRTKLRTMGRTIHAGGGLWLAPAAAGYDARLIGGRLVIPRRDGATLLAALDAARASSPDAIALISWNEFSENSHVEPSKVYGSTMLQTLADALGGHGAVDLPTQANDEPESSSGLTGWGALVVVLLALALFNTGLYTLRVWRRRRPRAPPAGGIDRRP